MAPRTHPFDPLIPGITLGRTTSGAIAGLAGGLLFGTMMLTNFAINDQVGSTGMVPLMQLLLGTQSPMVIWFVHIGVSIALGIVFSFFIAPHSYRSSVLWALGYVAVSGFIGSQLILRTLTGVPIVFDAGAAFALIGHLVYGLGLGIVYVAFHNLEVREAMDAESEKWREWGKRERDA